MSDNDAGAAAEAALAAARAMAAARAIDLSDLTANIEKLKSVANPLRDAPLQKLLSRKEELEQDAGTTNALVAQLEAMVTSVRALETEAARLKMALIDAEQKAELNLREFRVLTMRREQELADTIAAKDREMQTLTSTLGEEHAKAVDEKNKANEEKTKAIDERNKALDEKAKLFEEKSRISDEKTRIVEERNKAVEALSRSGDEKNKAQKELQAVKTELERVERTAMNALAERSKEIQTLRERAVHAVEEQEQHKRELTALRSEAATLRTEIAGLQELVEVLGNVEGPRSTPPRPAPGGAVPAPAHLAPSGAQNASVDIDIEKTPIPVLPPSSLPLPPGLPPPPPLSSGSKSIAWADNVSGANVKPTNGSADELGRAPTPAPVLVPPLSKPSADNDDLVIDDSVAPPDTRVRALPLLQTVTFTSVADQELAAFIPPTAISIAEIAQKMNLDVNKTCDKIWEFVALGLVEVE